MYEEKAKELLQFIEKSPSCFHVIANMKEELFKEGFVELKEQKKWKVEEGGKYFVTRNGSSIISFKVPSKEFKSFSIISSHSDSPSFKVKENPEMNVEDHYVKLNVEKYGGMLCAPWFDRPLSVAGRVMVSSEEGIQSILVNVDRDFLMIPNLAIHMNREANEGYRYNAQKDMLPLFGDGASKGKFMEEIAKAAGRKKEEIEGMDLFLYNRQKGSIWGADHEYLSSTKLDDLQCAYGSFRGFLEGENKSSVTVHCVMDNEEVGSGTKQGAASTFLKDVLKRLNAALGRTEEEYHMALASGFMISADNAHAVHPNQVDKADPVNRPYMNEGIVIKHSANQKYTTDAVSCAVMKRICNKAKVPYQMFTNRSDMPGGSTLGNISNTQVSLNTVDIGLAQLAMHSPYETCGVKDTAYLIKMAETFYSSAILMEEDGYYRLL